MNKFKQNIFRFLKRPSARLFISFLFIFFFAFFFYISDLTEYGATWDELIFHRNTGRTYLEFVRKRDLDIILKDSKAGWFPPIAPIVGRLFEENAFLSSVYSIDSDRFHIAAVFFASVTAGAIFLTTVFITNKIILGYFSAFLLIFHPQFVTQAHNNVRDMGLTMFYSVTILLFLLSSISKRKVMFFILAGIVGGITTATKQNGAFLVVIGFIWLYINSEKLTTVKFFVSAALFLIGFAATFILFWPFLWKDTFSHLFKLWYFLTEPGIIAGSTVFYDQVYTSMKNIPVYYPWVMLGILTPPLMVLAAGIGLVVSFISLFLKRKSQGLIFLWIFVPLSRFFVQKSSVTFDQIRHFFEVLPSLSVLVSLALLFLWRKTGKNKLNKGIIFALCLIMLFYNIWIVFLYRPYGTAYFNFFAGKAEYVNHAFDVEYWGNVYREAARYLNDKYGLDMKYYTAGLGAHILLHDGLKGAMTDEVEEDFDYAIFMNKQTWIRNNEYVKWLLKNKEPIYTIEREGKVLFYQFLPAKEEYLKSR